MREVSGEKEGRIPRKEGSKIKSVDIDLSLDRLKDTSGEIGIVIGENIFWKKFKWKGPLKVDPETAKRLLNTEDYPKGFEAEKEIAEKIFGVKSE